MSILIKGMKKPDCYSCPFEHNGYPDEWEMHCLLLDRQVGYFGKKLKEPKDCPIVEVPTPHGPLIDGDALYKTYQEICSDIACISCPFLTEDGCKVEQMIMYAPTIIEAEEEQ